MVVLLSAFNGFTIAMLSMLGEYVVRTLNAVSVERSFHVIERVALPGPVEPADERPGDQT